MQVTDSLAKVGAILALDIGSGTQDVLLALPDMNIESWPRFVLPAPAQQIAKRISASTRECKNIWLTGNNMGGGFARAINRHIEHGLLVATTSQAALALNDNLSYVEASGIKISETCPSGHVPIHLTDYSPDFWRIWLSAAELPQPSLILAAAQDHGVHHGIGNREGRFHLWHDLLKKTGGNPSTWIFRQTPETYTRLQTLQKTIGYGPVADTGAAAVLGALSVPEIRQRSWHEGILVINVGNSHTIAFLIFQEQVLGIYEHHTGMLSTESLLHDMLEFRMGWLPDEQVREAGGHGCVILPLPPEAETFNPTYILGPRRDLLAKHGSFIAPYGDMMLAGCHGLLYGFALLLESS